MRFARIDMDNWELESGEQRHARNPDKFWIPTRDARFGISIGQLAKLLFLIETVSENGVTDCGVERMWVLTTEVNAEFMIGRLVNQPTSIESGTGVYLSLGAEIPFRPDHVIEIHEWAREDVDDFLANAPYRRWYGRAP